MKISRSCIVLLCALALCLTSNAPLGAALVPDVPQIAYDTVPPQSWTMDALAWLAKRGRLGPYSARDFLISRIYTRVEIADILRDAGSGGWSNLDKSEKHVALQLAGEYRNELRYLGVDFDSFVDGLSGAADQSLLYNAWLYGDSVRSDSETVSRGIGSLTGMGLSGGQISYSATVSSERRLLHPGTSDTFPVLDRFGIRGSSRNWRWSAGRQYSWVGQAESGSMWLGNSSPALFAARAGREVRLPLIGRWWIDWEVGGWGENGDNFYLITRRFEKTFSRQWSLSILDMTKTTETPNPAMLVIPSQIYQALFLKQIDTKWNTVMGVEGAYHSGARLSAYAQWLVDDMENPFDKNPVTPTKTGFLVGVRSRVGEPMQGALRWRAEYAVLDRRTYEATRPDFPLLSWTQDGLPLGWPYGGNSRTLSLYAEGKIARKLDLTGGYIEVRDRDGNNPMRIFTISPSYDFRPDLSLGLMFQHSSSGGASSDALGLRALAAF